MTDQIKSSSAIARLLELSSQNDVQAMDSLYRVVSPQLFGMLNSLLPNKDLASDALERTFADIWKDGAAYRPDLGSPMSWLNHVARGHAADILRQQRRSSGTPWNAGILSEVKWPENSRKVAGLRTLGLDTDGSVQGHSADIQTMIKGAFLHGASVDELAQQFNTSSSQIKNELRGWMLGMREQING